MSVTIRLPAGVVLPERKFIVPGNDAPLERAQAGFQLANPADAAKFEMKVAWGEFPGCDECDK